MAEKPSPSETTVDLLARLRARERDGEIFLLEVGDGAGFRNRGWSDAISMQTWPSKKLVIRGYEIKASRSDWLRELDQPEKNLTWQLQCHEWYVVAPKDVVLLEELPPSWGLLVPRGEDQLRIASRAELNPNADGMVPISLMAAVFRAAANERRGLENQREREIQAIVEKRNRGTVDRLVREARDWEKRHMELVECLGNRWDNWERLKKTAAAVKALDDAQLDPAKLVREAKNRVDGASNRLARVLKDLEEISGETSGETTT